ncbi:unnamed protein product [Toxocara canis]|uniref:Uncharacterized protein n=1 Tax=Toxocara canis TaxID=6265 RepID=A0A183UPJ3_TOXCA|nr:unnamed protein product [Toxocara canis]
MGHDATQIRLNDFGQADAPSHLIVSQPLGAEDYYSQPSTLRSLLSSWTVIHVSQKAATCLSPPKLSGSQQAQISC